MFTAKPPKPTELVSGKCVATDGTSEGPPAHDVISCNDLVEWPTSERPALILNVKLSPFSNLVLQRHYASSSAHERRPVRADPDGVRNVVSRSHLTPP